MNLLRSALEFNARALSPILLDFRHTYTVDDIASASRNRESANATPLTFALYEQTISWNGSNLPRRVQWDGRRDNKPEETEPSALEVVPYGPVYLDNDDYYLLLPAVAINDLKTPGPMLYLKPQAQKFSVDRYGIVSGTPVTLFIDIPHGRAILLNYGLTGNVIRSYVEPVLPSDLEDDAIPTCCAPVVTLDELGFDIDWSDAGEWAPSQAGPNATSQPIPPAAGSSPASRPA